MKIARAILDGSVQFLAGRDGQNWVPLARLDLQCSDTDEVIRNIELVRTRLDAAADFISIAPEALMSPVVRPGKILAVGLNYIRHAEETGAKAPDRPLIFAKYTSSLNGPHGDVVIGAPITEQADYEVELAVIIGREAKAVAEHEVDDYIFGYAVANDVSARDWQRSDGQFSRSKSADTFCPIGPWITLAGEITSGSDLTLASSVNGEPRQSGSTQEMVFGVASLISYLSATITLLPGDVILTGTPPGVGLGFTPPRFLQPGDVVECSIEGLGTIRNRFVAAPSA